MDVARDTLFEFENYEDFQRERLKLNHENTLELWYSLPSDLSSIGGGIFRQQTRRQQKKRARNLKFFAIVSMLLNKSFLKKKIRSKGFHLWNKAFNIPSLKHAPLYEIYQSLGNITNQFLQKGSEYDPSISYEELFKAGRTVWFMIAFQIQTNSPLTLTDSIFGYNMLYPYTDNFVDSNQVSREAKKEFTDVFHQRLLHGDSDYNPNTHFNGTQSNINELTLPPSLTKHAAHIGKVFDMVKFIENNWKRSPEHQSVFMSLAVIHQSQMKSILQHAKSEENYQPTMEAIVEISAEKGGASLIAAGFLVEGHLTKEKMAYLEYLGFAMQLLDDLQVNSFQFEGLCCIEVFKDFHEDMANNHRTIFTQTHLDGQTLDEPTGRLIQYCYSSPAFQLFADDQATVSDSETEITLAYYVRISMMMFAIILMLEAASKLKEHYSKEFYQQLATLSPIPFEQLERISVEEKLWAIVRNQWF